MGNGSTALLTPRIGALCCGATIATMNRTTTTTTTIDSAAADRLGS
jgi:hypothetical protein